MKLVWTLLAVLMVAVMPAASEQDPWRTEQVVKPEELARVLAGPGEKPLLLHVGIETLYRNGHIPGSKYVGAGWSAQGLKRLQQEVAGIARNRPIVIYCGCCPWKDCPNVRPAFETLRGLGFQNVKVLYIATNFATDWAQKGFPVQTGE